jgi:hypothetical protein
MSCHKMMRLFKSSRTDTWDVMMSIGDGLSSKTIFFRLMVFKKFTAEGVLLRNKLILESKMMNTHGNINLN